MLNIVFNGKLIDFVRSFNYVGSLMFVRFLWGLDEELVIIAGCFVGFVKCCFMFGMLFGVLEIYICLFFIVKLIIYDYPLTLLSQLPANDVFITWSSNYY